jgi:hypothetical protein
MKIPLQGFQSGLVYIDTIQKNEEKNISEM